MTDLMHKDLGLALTAGNELKVPLAVTAATLVKLTISPRATTLALGSARQFVALGTFSDGTTQDLTSAATWSSPLVPNWFSDRRLPLESNLAR